MRIPRKNVGFTLVEILVVVGVTALLASLLLIYSRGSESGLDALRERTILVDTLYEAKAKAIETQLDASGAALSCAYGVFVTIFDPTRYILFRDTPAGSETACETGGVYNGNQQYDSSEEVRVITLPSGFRVGVSIGEATILFVPPDPQTRILPGNLSEVIIGIGEPGGINFSIRVTDSGQIVIE